MVLTMRCVEWGKRSEQWLLDLEPEAVSVRGPDGRLVGRWTPDEAAGRIVVPNLLNNVRHLTIIWDNGQLSFKVRWRERRELRRFFDAVVISQGRTGLSHLRHRAACQIGAGLGLIGAGVGISVSSHFLATVGFFGGYALVPHGLIVLGIPPLCSGAYDLVRYIRLRREAADVALPDSGDAAVGRADVAE